MADPIRVSIYFDAQGQAALERGADGVSRLSRRISELVQTTDGLPRAMRLAESHINAFGSAASRGSGQAITLLGNRIDALYGSVTRLAKYGFVALTVNAVKDVVTNGKQVKVSAGIDRQGNEDDMHLVAHGLLLNGYRVVLPIGMLNSKR